MHCASFSFLHRECWSRGCLRRRTAQPCSLFRPDNLSDSLACSSLHSTVRQVVTWTHSSTVALSHLAHVYQFNQLTRSRLHSLGSRQVVTLTHRVFSSASSTLPTCSKTLGTHRLDPTHEHGQRTMPTARIPRHPRRHRRNDVDGEAVRRLALNSRLEAWQGDERPRRPQACSSQRPLRRCPRPKRRRSIHVPSPGRRRPRRLLPLHRASQRRPLACARPGLVVVAAEERVRVVLVDHLVHPQL
jgi:hypothetical protein